ncbi:glycosyltransferase [Spongiactinospora sp. TRM90649]|uniref:glycosyltransferase n=1 Tax=Spongiactinospora sp. TRM90649 TaxID=3031114 RepID=UPI0023F9F836|nr:glycosyltransferase [Spongiactinospora sp. TRM90649]MDF5752899.1 glycosyltransferase [Spongiactinospora sp. TRM90649]
MIVDLVSEHADPLAAIGSAVTGGQNVHVAGLAGALAARGHTVTVHTRRTSPDQPGSAAMAEGVTVEYVPAGPAVPLPKHELLRHMPAFAGHLARRWAADRPDVVHAHFWMSGLAALAAARGVSVPVVQTYHALGTVKRRWQGVADPSPPQRVKAETDIGMRADAIVATCHDEAEELRAMGVSMSRVRVVPCGVDLDLFRPDGPIAPRDGDRCRVLSIGRLVPRKGVDTLVEALRDVPHAELVIAGGGPDDEEVRRLARLAARRAVADRVRLLGGVARADVPALMRSADVLVTVPWYEPFGMVPLEAMACGVPVIASAVGGHLDTVTGCGLLVPPRRPRVLARALRDLLDDPGLRAVLEKSGERRVQARYGWPKVAEAVETVYVNVLSARRRRPATA